MGSTNTALLGRLRDLRDAEAWQEFEARYRPRILAWCLRKGVRPADAEDLTQEVLFRVARSMPKFEYAPGGNFSGWLHTVWQNVWKKVVRKYTPGGQGTGDSRVWEQLRGIAAGDLATELRAEIERELLHEALARAQPQVSPRDWGIFNELVFAQRSLADVAAARGMTVAAVGMVKHRVQEKVKAVIVRLEGAYEEHRSGRP
jgi:RNA polymerase sigma factor (sigma-70 family)